MAHWTSGSISSRYAAYRPSYPSELFTKIARFCEPSRRQLAVDVGCGTGQAARGLAPHFAQVIGVDPSPTQVAEARKGNTLPNVRFVVGGAESFVLDEGAASANDTFRGKVDLITAAQALHWFDISKFTAHVTPLLSPVGKLAVWNYQTCRVEPAEIGRALDAMDAMLMREGYWPTQRAHVDDNYARLVPLIEGSGTNSGRATLKLIHKEQLLHSVEVGVPEFLLYLSTWSGVQRYTAEHPERLSLLEDFEQTCYANLCDRQQKVRLTFPINLFVFDGAHSGGAQITSKI